MVDKLKKTFNLPGTFKVIIEIPKGTMGNKYEYDEKSGEFKLDFVFENFIWPFNYGFIPGTKGGDGDTLDAIVLSSAPIKQGTEVNCKTIGLIEMLDRGQEDHKLICVPENDVLSKSLNDISDISAEQKQECEKLYDEIARQKKKVIKIVGFGNKEKASEEIKKSLI